MGVGMDAVGEDAAALGSESAHRFRVVPPVPAAVAYSQPRLGVEY